MKRSMSHGLVGLAVLVLGMTGCNQERYPSYSANVKYGLRTDPIVMKAPDLGEERFEPDRPGLMPIMRPEEMLRPDHPYHVKMTGEANVRSAAYFAAAKEIPIDKKAIEAAGKNYEQERLKLEEQRKQRQEELVPKVRANPGAYRREFEQALDKVLCFPTLSDQDKKTFEESLEFFFGTPAKPIVNATAAGIDPKVIEELKLDDKTLAEGSSYYRVHCVHCHGVPGNGRGPTARWINPHPRDFRRGYFKFQSNDRGANIDVAPSRADLLRTLRQGLEGTAMPSFGILPDHELEALSSYVIHLSVRGEAEHDIFAKSFTIDPADTSVLVLKKDQDDERKDEDLKENVKFYAKKLVESRWHKGNQASNAIKVAPYPYNEKADDYLTKILPASVKRGQEIFLGAPSNESKAYFVAQVFPGKFEAAKAADLERRLQTWKDALYEKREPDALMSPKAKKAEAEALQKAADEAAKDEKRKKLTESEINEVKDSVKKMIQEDLQKEIDESSKKEIPRLKAESAKDDTKIEAELKSKLLENAQSLFGNKCVQCHVDYGRQAKFKYDEWGTLVRPNNLTLGVYRGGKRPVDVYYRVHSGIPGTPMVHFGAAFAGNEQYLWDVINFVTVLPYPKMRESLGIKID